MKRHLFVLLLLALALTSFGCSHKGPYSITERTTQGPGGIIVTIKAMVPLSATHAEMEDWCGTISRNEGPQKVVTVEFLEQEPIKQQMGLCAGGKVYGDLASSSTSTH